MTTTTVPPAAVGRVPLPRLLRAAWYRQKTGLIGILALYLAAAAILLYRYESLRSHLAARHLLNCLGAPVCQAGDFYMIIGNQIYSYATMFGYGLVIGVAVIFGGVRWLTREYESGGFRYTWAQATSPSRWFATNWVLLVVATIAGAAVTCAAYQEWHSLVWMQLDGSPYNVFGFFTRPAGYLPLAFAAVSLGMLAAATIRRTIPAMAAALAGYVGLFAATAFAFVPWLLSLNPVTITTTFNFGAAPGNGYFVRDWWTDAAGKVVPGWAGNGQPFTSTITWPFTIFIHPPHGNENDAATWLTAHHFTYWLSYQPTDRIGLFHAIVAAGLVLVGLLGSGLAFWQVRSRRP
jgi:hypothetical protein